MTGDIARQYMIILYELVVVDKFWNKPTRFIYIYILMINIRYLARASTMIQLSLWSLLIVNDRCVNGNCYITTISIIICHNCQQRVSLEYMKHCTHYSILIIGHLFVGLLCYYYATLSLSLSFFRYAYAYDYDCDYD